jgi:hypothetical protein
MPSHRRPTPRAVEFVHGLKTPLEQWLILGARLKEVGRAVADVVDIYSGTGKGRDLKVSNDKVALVRPLYCFSVVTYIRCFGGGRRPPLKIEEIPQLTARDRKTHEEASRLRNKHYAHAVADEEGASILITQSQGALKSGFVTYDVTIATPNVAEVRAFLSLVRKVSRFVLRKEHESGNALAQAVIGPKATWTKCLKHGAAATKRDA